MTLEMNYLDYQYKGLKQGLEQGLEQGRAEQIKMLKKLMESGAIGIKEAAEAYGVTEEELKHLLSEH